MPRRHALKRVGSSPNPPDEFKKPDTSFMFSLHSLKKDTHAFDKTQALFSRNTGNMALASPSYGTCI